MSLEQLIQENKTSRFILRGVREAASLRAMVSRLQPNFVSLFISRSEWFFAKTRAVENFDCVCEFMIKKWINVTRKYQVEFPGTPRRHPENLLWKVYIRDLAKPGYPSEGSLIDFQQYQYHR